MSLFSKVPGSVVLFFGLSAIAPAQRSVILSTHTQPLGTTSYTDVTNALAVDLNNDGVVDLVLAETPNFTTMLSVSLAKGDGTFQPQHEVTISSSAVPEGPLFFGDFNNDGNADIGMLVTMSQTSGTTAEIAILLGKGDGTFQATKLVPVTLTNAGFGSERPIVADYNRDGNQDLVASMTAGAASGVYVYPGDGKGGFSAPKPILLNLQAAPSGGGDFDGDGNADIAYYETVGAPCTVHDPPCATDLHVLYGDGKFGFKDVTQYHSAAPFDFRTGDLNSDGRTDIFLFDQGNGLKLVALYGQSNRSFTNFSMATGPVQSTLPAMADMNGDGQMDLVVYGNTTTSATYNEYVIFLANTNGGFTRENVLAPSFDVAPSPPILADLHGENKPDILEPAKTAEDTNRTIVVALNRTTSFFPSCSYPQKGSGISFCNPGIALSPVVFDATASSFGQIRKIELWVDGAKIGEQYHTWGQRAWMNSVGGNFSAGTHNATVFEVDTDGRLQKVTAPFTVGRCSAPSSPGVHVCLPANNGTTQSPVTVQATAKTSDLARMELWVDGVKKFTVGNASFGYIFSLKTGTHRIVVIAVDYSGAKYSTAVSTTVH